MAGTRAAAYSDRLGFHTSHSQSQKPARVRAGVKGCGRLLGMPLPLPAEAGQPPGATGSTGGGLTAGQTKSSRSSLERRSRARMTSTPRSSMSCAGWCTQSPCATLWRASGTCLTSSRPSSSARGPKMSRATLSAISAPKMLSDAPQGIASSAMAVPRMGTRQPQRWQQQQQQQQRRRQPWPPLVRIRERPHGIAGFGPAAQGA